MIYLLGDSIRLGMQKSLLRDVEVTYLVNGPEKNLGDSRSLLNFVEKFDFVKEGVSTLYLNAGLHDIRFHRSEKSIQVEVSEYKSNLLKLIQILKDKSVANIFVGTTTPFNEIQHNKVRVENGSPFARYLKDLDLYNSTIKDVVIESGVVCIDLYSIALKNKMLEYLVEDGLHLNSEGYFKLGKLLVDEIKKAQSED